MNNPKPIGRQNLSVAILMPPDERQRLADWAAALERPASWITRDALRLYFDALDANPTLAARLKAPSQKIPLAMAKAGATHQPRRGRKPPKQ
jgi:hypothetical protein